MGSTEKACSPPPVPVYQPRQSWVLDQTGASLLHARGFTGKGVRIGHLDTGFLPQATDLRERIRQQVEFNPEGEVVVGSRLQDQNGHGTRTASLLVGKIRNRMHIGLAPDATLVSGKVLEGGLSILRILKGLNWMADQKVPLVLLCAGLPYPNPVFQPMMAFLRKQNTLPICPIGNGGSDSFFSPGDDPSVLSVGAIDQAGKVPRFSGSRRGQISTQVHAPDVLAPGHNIPCATATRRSRFHGTSLSAAIVAGVATLLLEAVPDATADELYTALCQGSTPLDKNTCAHARCGVLHARQALEYLQNHRNQSTTSRPLRSTKVAAGWRDPRLLRQLERTGVEEQLTAIYILLEKVKSTQWKQQAAAYCASFFQQIAPSKTAWLPKGRALVLSGSPKLHRLLIADNRFTYASAADAGRTLPAY